MLTVLTLILTTVYQWGWVTPVSHCQPAADSPGHLRHLSGRGRRGADVRAPRIRSRPDDGRRCVRAHDGRERGPPAAVRRRISPTVPAYGAHPALLFGFLLLVDAGLLAIAIGLGRMSLHAIAGLATVLIWAVWLSTSYADAARSMAIAFVSAFVAFYLLAPTIARRFGRPLTGVARQAAYAGPASLFVFAVIAYSYPAAASPWPLFAPLLGLVVLCAWRAIALEQGGLFFAASFLAVAAEAVWSARHLTVEHLPAAVSIYALFGIVTAAVPLDRAASRASSSSGGRRAAWSSSPASGCWCSCRAVRSPRSPCGRSRCCWPSSTPVCSSRARPCGCRCCRSWAACCPGPILGLWWYRTAAVVGILPSLAVVTGLTLITLGGHAWAHVSTGGPA